MRLSKMSGKSMRMSSLLTNFFSSYRKIIATHREIRGFGQRKKIQFAVYQLQKSSCLSAECDKEQETKRAIRVKSESWRMNRLFRFCIC